MGGFASLREYLNTVQGNVDADDGLIVREKLIRFIICRS